MIGSVPTSPALSASKRRRMIAPSVVARRDGVDRLRVRGGHRRSARARGIPATFVGTPAVIAWTTSCWVVVAPVVDADVAAEPEHGDPVGDLEDVVEVVRDEDDREPLLGEPLTSSSTCWVCATPSAAVGSSRITTREFHITARPIATDWRWPPERLATGCRIELDRRHAQAPERLGRPLLHRRLAEPADEVALLAAEVHVLDDVEVVAEREILVDDLDPELRRVLRPADRDLLPVEPGLALVDRVDAGDALDQRRLAGAVVADERHDLARAHLEVDVGRARRPSRSSCGCLAPRASASPRRWWWVSVSAVAVICRMRSRAPARGAPSTEFSQRLLAELLVRPAADLALLEVAV